MVDIAKRPLKQRVKNLSQDLYTAEHQSGPGEVPLPREVYDDLMDILQELTNLVYGEKP